MEKIILYVDDAAYARDFLANAPAETVGLTIKSSESSGWALIRAAAAARFSRVIQRVGKVGTPRLSSSRATRPQGHSQFVGVRQR